MGSSIRTRVIRIGNSQGIRIPKLLLEQVDFDENEEVELEVQVDHIVIRPAYEARHGWDKAFKAMAERGDDALLDEEAQTATEWEEEEWEW